MYVTIHHHYCTLSFPSHSQSTHPSLQVLSNPSLKKLCASKLESAGRVCIGNKEGGSDIAGQPFLDADLSELETGVFFSFPACYQDSNASTVCGTDNGFGLFSSPSGRCPSNACMMPLMSDNK